MSRKETRLERLSAACEKVGLYVTTYSPGDGTTRYRFSEQEGDYFAVRPEFTALGYREAYVFARGRGAVI